MYNNNDYIIPGPIILLHKCWMIPRNLDSNEYFNKNTQNLIISSSNRINSQHMRYTEFKIKHIYK